MVRGLIFILIVLLISCEKPTESIDCSSISEGKGIELIYPTGGESFKIGNKVTVKWKVDTDVIQDQASLEVSVNGSSGPFLNVFERGIAVPASNGGIVCMDTIWTIGQEYDDMNYGSSQTVLLRVGRYSHHLEVSDVSRMITISE